MTISSGESPIALNWNRVPSGISHSTSARSTITELDPAMVSKLTSDDGVRLSGALKNLSPRELQVLGLMAKAHSNRAIAEALFFQPRTVEHHISSVLAKLGFNSNGERHGRVFAILTYLESTAQLPMHEGDIEVADPNAPIQMIA